MRHRLLLRTTKQDRKRVRMKCMGEGYGFWFRFVWPLFAWYDH